MTYYILTDIAGKHALTHGRKPAFAKLGRKGTVAEPGVFKRFETKAEAAAKAKSLKSRGIEVKPERRQSVAVALRYQGARHSSLYEFPTQAAAKAFCRAIDGSGWEWAIEVPKKA